MRRHEPDLIDARARQIAEDAMRCVLGEVEARWQTAVLVHDSGVARDVVRRFARTHPMNAQAVEDMTVDLEELLVDKVMDAGRGGYSITRVLMGSSFVGWCRQLGVQAMRSVVAKHNRQAGLLGVPVDPTHTDTEATTAGGGAQRAYLDAPHVEPGYAQVEDAAGATDDGVGSELREMVVAAVVTGFEDAARGSRGVARTHHEARALRAVFDLPVPIRPLDPAERDWVCRRLEDDPGAAYEALAALDAIVEGRASDIDLWVDERLLALWDDTTAEQRARLLVLRHDVAHTIALSAVSPRPKPTRAAVAGLTQILTSASREPGWTVLARELTTALVAAEAQPVSDFDTKTSPAQRAAAAADAHRLASRLLGLLDTAAGFPGSPLGATADDVHARCMRAWDAAEPPPLKEMAA